MGELCALPIGEECGFSIDSLLYGHPTANSIFIYQVINCYVSAPLPTKLLLVLFSLGNTPCIYTKNRT
jgi:hypothetical protein